MILQFYIAMKSFITALGNPSQMNLFSSLMQLYQHEQKREELCEEAVCEWSSCVRGSPVRSQGWSWVLSGLMRLARVSSELMGPEVFRP